MLTKELLRVSRAGGGYSPRFADREHRPLAAKVLGAFEESVGDSHGELDAALTDLEREAEDFKLVRGLGKLLEREASFETRAPVDPERARRAAFEAGEAVGVTSESERDRALERAAADFGTGPGAVADSLYADLESRQVLASVTDRFDPDDLIAQYNLSLAQTALFDATEIRIRSSDPRRLVSAVKRLGLLYEVRNTTSGRELLVTGPDALFRSTRRYGTRFARLLRSVVDTADWELTATIDDRGAERTLELSNADPLRPPDAEPVVEVSYDSTVERDFAARFSALDLDWDLTREPEPLEVGASVMIPDFVFDYRYGDFRVYFEIMGFWTPEYVEKKLAQLDDVESVELLVAVDESLNAGDEIEARDHRAIPYSGTVGIKAVRDALRRYEDDLVAENAAALPDVLAPEDDAVTLADLAARHGVSEDALARVAFPDHERIGRTLVRPAVLDRLGAAIEPGQSLAEAEEILAEAGIDEASAALSSLGYRIEWAGLSGGTVRTLDSD